MDSHQLSIISCIQKIVIYETKARYYVVGSNNTESRFRVLKIDRTEPKDLHIVDDKVEYSQRQIRELLLMIDVGNRPKQPPKGGNGLIRIVSAFGIVGFVRFLEGYYIVLITKRRKVGLIGPHTIYKIEDTRMVYIPNDSVRYQHPDEQKYVKMFQNVDLSSNFYFSYSYDLTHSLQYNMTNCQNLPKFDDEASLGISVTMSSSQGIDHGLQHHGEVEDAEGDVSDLFAKDIESDKDTTTTDNESAEDEDTSKKMFADKSKAVPLEDSCTSISNETSNRKGPIYGVRTLPAEKFVWNSHLLKNVKDDLHVDWIIYIIHGFIGQSKLAVFGKPIYVMLIARRSNKFAGTRFLKRGANTEGDVANEVETEQIVHDASISNLQKCRITSITQLRGSLPLQWSQDISKMVPKPNIEMDQSDPFGYVAGQHFNEVMKRYGAPVIILNLVKKREKKRHESILTEELLHVVQYLNQFLPPEHFIRYIGFDMARVSKSKDISVMTRLAEIAEYCVKKTGFFQTGPDLYCNKLRPHAKVKGLQHLDWEYGKKQRGVIRTNCVDCLDRTNTAQFAIGKCALGFQLYAMGIIHNPTLQFDTDCVRMLEDLYEDQGDTLALQYGGSQLVHRIKGYRKIAPWTSSSKDIMSTLSRYYSNAFSDADKQNAMNLFLGVFLPQEGQPNVWELTTDFYLHNQRALYGLKPRDRSYCQWWELPVVQALPAAYDEVSKGTDPKDVVLTLPKATESVNMYWEHYRPYELTVIDEHYAFHMPDSIRHFMPKFATSYSPFDLRVRPGRKQEEYGNSLTEANPNVSGKDSTASVTSTGSTSDSGSTSSSEESDLEGDIDVMDNDEFTKEDSGLSMISLKDLFPTMAQTYGMEILPPDKGNTQIYKRYVEIGQNASEVIEGTAAKKGTHLVQTSIWSMDSSFSVEPPKVNTKSRGIYKAYVGRGKQGAKDVSSQNIKVYRDYLKTKFL